MNRAIAALSGALLLSGCTTFSGRVGEPVPLEDLIRQVKKDIGEYNAYAANAATQTPLNNACKGKIDLTIRSVTVSVTTSSKITDGVNGGATVQPNAFVKVGVSG